jgi:hypothetical protein
MKVALWVLQLMLLWAIPAGCMQRKEATKMQGVPKDVQEYLTAGDSLARKSVEEKHPNIRKKLESPETRAALLRYLASNEPWEEAHPGAVINALGVIQPGASASEAVHLRPLLMHPVGAVRLGAYDFLMAVYYPDDRGSVLTLLQAMLLDADDSVRAQGAQYVKGIKGQPELGPFLERWLKLAVARGWSNQESFEMVQRLVQK